MATTTPCRSQAVGLDDDGGAMFVHISVAATGSLKVS